MDRIRIEHSHLSVENTLNPTVLHLFCAVLRHIVVVFARRSRSHPVALRSCTLGAIAVGTMLAARVAVASPAARLAYARGTDAETCPDEAVLRAGIAKRVGYDPFFPWATRTVIVQIEKRGRAFVARVQVLDAKGVVHGERSAQCADVQYSSERHPSRHREPR